MSDAKNNTDRELWREREGDYYADSLFVTEGGGIGMNVGGYCIVLPIREWFQIARPIVRTSDEGTMSGRIEPDDLTSMKVRKG